MTATSSPAFDSSSEKKRPCSMLMPMTASYAGYVPVTMAEAFSVADAASALPIMTGTTTSYETPSSLCMALTSSTVISRL